MAAIDNPVKLNSHMYDGQKTRRVLDRLVGYKISPLLWDRVQRGISAGRVQSVALRLIVEREDVIKAFIPEQWFSIQGKMEKNKIAFEIKYFGKKVVGKKDELKDELKDEKIAKQIVREVKNKFFTVMEVKNESESKIPLLLFLRPSYNKRLPINWVLVPNEL